jgi:hypothetical protein
MNIIYRILQASALVALFVAGSMGAYAQLSFDIHDTVITVAPDDLAGYNFEVLVTNTSDETLQLIVIRTGIDFPNQEWYTAICDGDLCYSPDVSETSRPLDVGESAKIKLYMKGGSQQNTSGRAKLAFKIGFGSPIRTIGFTMHVSDAAGVPALSQLAGSALYPNPTTGRMRFEYSLPTSGDVAISVSSMTGQQLLLPVAEFQAAGSHAVDLDLSTLPVGAYVVTLNSRTTRGTQIVTVTR